ncbi:MAG: hypothetical protein JSV88_33365 [Candidatus Aminicenantes bacterium]|nr:MAG: hypothetical protein JSV88_33365 [Candidatus Aminicenantes bacterium]
MDRDHLQIKLKAILLNIIGIDSYYIEFDENLRLRQSWDTDSEKEFQELIYNEFDINVDLKGLSTLTLDNIADLIQEFESNCVQ